MYIRTYIHMCIQNQLNAHIIVYAHTHTYIYIFIHTYIIAHSMLVNNIHWSHGMYICRISYVNACMLYKQVCINWYASTVLLWNTTYYIHLLLLPLPQNHIGPSHWPSWIFKNFALNYVVIVTIFPNTHTLRLTTKVGPVTG